MKTTILRSHSLRYLSPAPVHLCLLMSLLYFARKLQPLIIEFMTVILLFGASALLFPIMLSAL